MMRIDPDRIKLAEKILTKEKVFTLNRLVEILKCSSRTAQAKLKLWKTYTSYNQNGRYYTMPQVPRFDGHGLWRYEEIFFSKHGNLKQTVIHLIHASEAGLSGNDIGLLVGLAPRSFMHHFKHAPSIRREKKDGVFIYFSDDSNKYKEQHDNRMAAMSTDKRPLGEDDVVAILTAIIRRRKISIDEIMAWPEIKSRNLSYRAIQEFLVAHGLLKKTPVTKR